jgi:hypothetical protein
MRLATARSSRPGQAGHTLDDSAARSGDEDTPGSLIAFPSIEGVDEVESRPGDLNVGVYPLGGEGIGDQPKTFWL